MGYIRSKVSAFKAKQYVPTFDPASGCGQTAIPGAVAVAWLFAIAFSGVVLFSQKAIAEESTVASAPAASEQIEEVVVTGSRIRRSNLTTSTPLTVISEAEYDLAGITNIEQLLNTMPQVQPGEGGFTNNATSGVATVDLRGLGIQRSLVLVNGRRWISFDARQVADLNTLPAGLIESTELVTGGSSAVYGSDAIGGVVNFQLKDDFEGIELDLHHGASSKGDGERTSVDLTMGGNFDGGKGNAVVYLNYLDRDSVLAGDRDQSYFFMVDSTDEDGNPILAPGGSTSIPNGRMSGFPVTGPELEARPGLQQALNDAGLSNVGSIGLLFDDAGQDVRPFVRPDDEFNFNPQNYLQLPQERRTIGANASYEFIDGIEGYVEAMFVQNIVETKRAPTNASGSQLLQVDSPFLPAEVQNILGTLDATEGSLQFDANGDVIRGANGLPVIVPAATRNDGYTTVSVARRILEAGTRDVTFERNSWRTVVGLRGDLGDLGVVLKNATFDMYMMHSRTRNTTNEYGSIISDAFDQGITTAFDDDGNVVCLDQSGGCVPINMFGRNQISDEAIEWMSTNSTSSEEATMDVAAAILTGDLFSLPAGDVGIAVGAEYRNVSGLFVPSQGGIGDTDTDPTGGSYHLIEAFAEVLIPVLDNLEVTGAGRISDYSLDGIGTSETFGTGFTWSALPSVMIRGQYQRAVRAPSIDELFVAQSGTSPAAVDPCAEPEAATDPVVRDLCIANGVPISSVGDPGIQPNFQIREVTGGNPNLDEESTDTYTLGVVFTPDFAQGLSVTVDYYDITVEDAISQLGGNINNVLDLCFNRIQDISSRFCQAVERIPESGIIGFPGGVFAINENIGELATSGVDMHINYGGDLGFGLFGQGSSFDVAFAGSWLDEFRITPVAELPQEVDVCEGAFGLTCDDPRPEFKATTRVSWYNGPLTLSLKWRWMDGVEDDQITNGSSTSAELAVPRIGSVSYVDLTAQYRFGDNYTVRVGVGNLFDKEQPIIGSSQEQLNTFPSTYDPFGRLIFMNFSARVGG